MYEYNCNVVKVVDGDTVDVDIDLGFGMWLKNERVRLYGIDTPECRTRDPEEKLCGMYAKKVVQDYLPKGVEVEWSCEHEQVDQETGEWIKETILPYPLEKLRLLEKKRFKDISEFQQDIKNRVQL